MAVNTQRLAAVLTALEGANQPQQDVSSPSNADFWKSFAPTPPPSGGFDWKGGLGKLLNVVSMPLHAVTSLAVTGGREVGKYGFGQDYGANNPTLQNMLGMITDPSKEVNFGDIVSGKPEKGLTAGVFDVPGRTPAGSLTGASATPLERGALGLGGDVVLDPLTYVEGGGAAKSLLGREAAQSTARQALEQAAKEGGADFSKEAIAEAVAKAGDHTEMLGKIREAAGNSPEVQRILNEGSDVAARARRYGVSKLTPDEVGKYLTKEGALEEPLAHRGLDFAHKLIPGTDSPLLGRLGELKSNATAKLGDMFGGSTADKAFTEQTTREITAAARSGNPKAAYEAILAGAARDTAKHGARALIAGWSGKLASLTKDFSEEDMKNLRPALEGDQAAIDALDGAHSGVRDLLNDIHTRGTEAGLQINKIADYAPRELSPEGRKLLESKDFFHSDKLGPTSSFERARSLVPDANGDYHFGGETFKAANNAEVSSKVNEIAKNALEKIDPEAAKNMTGFFNEDAKGSLDHYINRAARRISESDAATRLYAMGIGNAKYRMVADKTSQAMAGGIRDAATEADHGALQQVERATMHEGAQDELGRHLLGQRLGQLDSSLAGTPVTSPLSDAQDAGLAAAAHQDAQAAVQAAHARLDTLDAAAKARVEAGSASAKSLQEDINNLRSRIASVGDASTPDGMHKVLGLESRIHSLENEHTLWINRRDSILSDALTGTRSDVVMPKGFRTIEGEITPIGGFREVAPKVAWRNAGAVHEAVQDATARGAALAEAKAEFARAVLSGQDGRAKAAEAFDRFIGIASPNQGDLAEAAAHSQKLGTLIDSHYTADGALDVSKMRKTMDRVTAAVEKDKALAVREQARASKLAETATRSKDGIVEGALYHGTPQRWANDALGPRNASNSVETLDLTGLYTTDDHTGKILLGERPLTEKPDLRGYTAPPGLNPSEIPGGTVYSYVPRDPSTTLLPTDRLITSDDVTPTLRSAIDHFYGGDEWNSHFFEPHTGDPHLDELAREDPIAAFLAHDLADYASQRGLHTLTTEDLVNAHYATDDNGIRQFVGGMRREFADASSREAPVEDTLQHSIGSIKGTTIFKSDEFAADHVNAMADHWYDTYDVKGYTREGGNITGRATTSPHTHSIWVRPNDDLEMVGKADFSAAWAEKRARQALQDKTRLTDALKVNKADEATLATKEGQLAKVNEQLAKSDREQVAALTGTGKQSVARQRAALAVQSAEDQAKTTEQYMNDTVGAIQARRAAHLEEAHRITALLANPAPLPADAVEHMRSYIEDLHQSVLYGRVHEKALEVGDRQLTRYAALEQAAAEASATAHDLHQKALTLGDIADKLSDKQIQQVTDAFNAGAKQELRPGLGTPENIANWLHGAQPYSSADGMRKFFKQTDKVVQWIKAWQIATPAFQVRNLMGGEFLNAEAGVSMESRFGFIKAYSKELRGKPLTTVEQDLMDRVRQAVGRGQVEAESGAVGTDSQVLGMGKGTVLPSRNNYVIHASQRAGRQVDFYNRGVLAWHTMANGGTLDDAVAAVNKFHFDYSDLSHFEQNLRHVVPFYTFTRKNLPLQIEQLINNPKIYSRLAAAKYETENLSTADKTVPSYYADMLGIRLPWEHGGGHMYATPDLPASSLQNFSSPKNIENNLLGMVTPLIKAPIEAHFSKQFFEGIPLSDKKAVPVPLPAMLTKGLAPVLEATGLAHNVDGHLFMTEKNAYVLGQFVPVIARYSRMMPADQKGRSRQLAQLLTWAGFRVEDDSALTQQSYAKGQKYQAQNAASTDKAFVKAAKALIAGTG